MSYLTKEQIVFGKGLVSRKDAIYEIACLAVNLGIADDLDALFQSFMERENMSSTGFGGGFAIPHAKCEQIKEAKIIILKSATPIEWEAIDNMPVYIAVALLVPKDNANLHIRILSQVARQLTDKNWKNELLNSKNKEQILQLFCEKLLLEE